MKRKIELLADYGCSPLWEYEDNDLVDNAPPSEYPLSEKTIERLLNWQKIYDGIIDWDDPASAGFASEQEEIAFEREGISLWQQLQKELGDDYEIVYFSQLQHRVVTHLDELEKIDIFQKA
jgi:hypothetical protein